MAFNFSGFNYAGTRFLCVPAIVKLGTQIEDMRPGRYPVDGTVASEAHNRRSDHTPDDNGWVRAIDFGGPDASWLVDRAEQIRLSRDPRVRYVIHNERMYSSYPKPGYPSYTWRPYTGANGHITHIHVSVLTDDTLENDTDPWQLTPTEEPDMPQLTDDEYEFFKRFKYSVEHGMTPPSDPAFPEALVPWHRANKGLPNDVNHLAAQLAELTARVDSIGSGGDGITQDDADNRYALKPHRHEVVGETT